MPPFFSPISQRDLNSTAQSALFILAVARILSEAKSLSKGKLVAFTPKHTVKVSFESPEALFHDLRSRSVEGLLAHQADILRRYQAEAFDKSDVAIELPTGSGKTLVGLLIAEFRRLTRNERVVYLCPTRQLVRQVVEQSEKKYGIKATAFVGRIKDFNPSDKAKFLSAQTVAVAPYSALFNTNPFFSSPNLIILDDAHAAENYIGSAWSVDINRTVFKSIYDGLLELLRSFLAPHVYGIFADDSPKPSDANWIEKIPSPRIADLQTTLDAFLDAHTADTDLQYPWSFLKGHLDACHLYISHGSILIRPYIPPAMTHQPFATATQRVYMSATLGRGGDLERITGVPGFHRLPIPKGWDKQGIGRRFFMFPEQSLKGESVNDLIPKLMERAHRSLVLVPSDKAAEYYRDMVGKSLKYAVFDAQAIESSKATFTKEPKAVAVLANRYDGIDLIGDECRLLIIRGLPRATNIQERFLMSRMAAGNLLDDRIRTRIIQAVGRCTRSATDYAAVCILGDDFDDWLILEEKRSLFHPELQGELQFGFEQSVDKEAEDFAENLDIFLKHKDEWNDVDTEILELRDKATQKKIQGEEVLLAAANHEVHYTYAIWNHDYGKSVTLAAEIASLLSGDDTKGFRGFWYYLAGAAAELASREGGGKEHLREVAAGHFLRAAACAPSVAWLRKLIPPAEVPKDSGATITEECLQSNVERMELTFERRGFASPKKFEKEAKSILDGLAGTDPDKFEEAHRSLGELLGFDAGNANSDAAPDPWWISAGKLCIVSEDKSDSKAENPIAVKHTRQAATHSKWMLEHAKLAEKPIITCVMITPATTIHPEASTYAEDVKYWHLEDFRKWAQHAVASIRKFRGEYPGPGNLGWRAAVCDGLKEAKLDPMSIFDKITAIDIKSLPSKGGREVSGMGSL
jgi:hypothetical protein